MKRIAISALLFTSLLSFNAMAQEKCCKSKKCKNNQEMELKTELDSISYGLGVSIAKNLKDQGITEWETAVGIRADEPRRVSKMRQKAGYLTPLADKGLTSQDVIEFWSNQDFDLQLPASGFYSNCDLCFLKGYGIKQSLVNENDKLAIWWADQELRLGARFRSDQPSYTDMIAVSGRQTDLWGYDSTPCFCGD